MLGSEVIKQIQNLIDEYGDLPIEISLNGSDQELDIFRKTCKSFYKNRKI